MRYYLENNIWDEDPDEPNDPNRLRTFITSNEPIIVPWGPRCGGRTVFLLRFSSYLVKVLNYEVSIDWKYRTDKLYSIVGEHFMESINSPIAPSGTGLVNLFMAKVQDPNERTLFSMFEGSELFFSLQCPLATYIPAINQIINANNIKVYLFFLEFDWMRLKERRLYADSLIRLLSRIRKIDKIIIVVNKIDRYPEFFKNSKIDVALIKERIIYEYPKLFERMAKRGSLKCFLNPALMPYDLIPFSSAEFNQTYDGDLLMTYGSDIYPETMWKCIKNNLKL